MPSFGNKGTQSIQESLTSEIIPLQRTRVMDNRTPDDDNIPRKKRQHNADSMYPGFGSLLACQLNPNPPPFASANTGPSVEHAQQQMCHKAGEEKADSGKAHAKKSPRGRKKRRRISNASSVDSNTVQHEYHDYSGLSGAPVVLPTLIKKGRGGVSSMFPTVLHHMLDDAEKNGFDDVISWQTHGRCFIVHQPKKFVDEVMPKYFRHTRLSSFQRQLSLYGFTRLARKGPDHGAYYHE